MKKNFLVVIVGPTAVGKTDTAITLAKHFNSVIISADSRQIYKELNIGTAKPSEQQLKSVKHFFIGNKSIFQYYNASFYETEVLQLLEKLFKTYNPIFLVGGSGLYVNAVLYGIDDMPTIKPHIRKQLMEIYKQKGLNYIQQMLKKYDPKYYEIVDLNNPSRILKALEVSIQSGKPYSSFLKKQPKPRFFEPIIIGLNMDRKKLFEKINLRVDNMIKNGLIQEAKQLYPYKHLTALNTVGYKELFDYFEGKISLNEAIDLIKRHTRNYARKQITWFKKYKQIKWFEPTEIQQIINYINQKISENGN